MTFETSARHGLPLLKAAQAQKELTHNEALTLLDMAVNASVVAVGPNEPPAAPTMGQCWIVGGAPVGVWAGHAQSLACWTAGGWRFVPAFDGMRVWSAGARLEAVYDGEAWRLGEVRCNRLFVGPDQVIGPRQAGIQLPAGGGSIDVAARAAITAIIDRLVAHGLIAGSP